MRAEASGISLTSADAAIVKGMIARGDRQHDIAAWFGVNGGRIGEIATGEKFSEVEAKSHDLPPSGPYASGKDVERAKQVLKETHGLLSKVLAEIESELDQLK